MPQADKNIHIAGEAAAVFILSPVLLYIAYSTRMATWKKWFLVGTVAATLMVDGYLLKKWRDHASN